MGSGKRHGVGVRNTSATKEAAMCANVQQPYGPADESHIGIAAGTTGAAGSGTGPTRRFHGVEAGPSPTSYRHEALLWHGDDEFLAGTVPFILDGLAAKQPVLVAVTAPHIQLLRAALGANADRVLFVDMAVLGRNPARLIPAWLDFIDEYGQDGQPLRGIGEPIWPGRRPAEVAECQLHEALLNVAITTQTPLWLLCPYDAATLAENVLIEAKRCHHLLGVEQVPPLGDTYSGSDHVRKLFESDLPEVGVLVSRRTFGHDHLHVLREEITTHARRAGISKERSADLALAAHEIAINSIEHGTGERVRRIWLHSDSLVCELHDDGHVRDPMIGRRPPAESNRGRGLWMANQLGDLVQIRSNDAGTTIRIHTWLP